MGKDIKITRIAPDGGDIDGSSGQVPLTNRTSLDAAFEPDESDAHFENSDEIDRSADYIKNADGGDNVSTSVSAWADLDMLDLHGFDQPQVGQSFKNIKFLNFFLKDYALANGLPPPKSLSKSNSPQQVYVCSSEWLNASPEFDLNASVHEDIASLLQPQMTMQKSEICTWKLIAFRKLEEFDGDFVKASGKQQQTTSVWLISSVEGSHCDNCYKIGPRPDKRQSTLLKTMAEAKEVKPSLKMDIFEVKRETAIINIPLVGLSTPRQDATESLLTASEEGYKVLLDIPGVLKDDVELKVSTNDNSVSVALAANEKKKDPSISSKRGFGIETYKYLVRERPEGNLHRKFRMPEDCDVETGFAKVDDCGILVIDFLKKKPDRHIKRLRVF